MKSAKLRLQNLWLLSESLQWIERGEQQRRPHRPKCTGQRKTEADHRLIDQGAEGVKILEKLYKKNIVFMMF